MIVISLIFVFSSGTSCKILGGGVVLVGYVHVTLESSYDGGGGRVRGGEGVLALY